MQPFQRDSSSIDDRISIEDARKHLLSRFESSLPQTIELEDVTLDHAELERRENDVVTIANSFQDVSQNWPLFLTSDSRLGRNLQTGTTQMDQSRYVILFQSAGTLMSIGYFYLTKLNNHIDHMVNNIKAEIENNLYALFDKDHQDASKKRKAWPLTSDGSLRTFGDALWIEVTSKDSTWSVVGAPSVKTEAFVQATMKTVKQFDLAVLNKLSGQQHPDTKIVTKETLKSDNDDVGYVGNITIFQNDQREVARTQQFLCVAYIPGRNWTNNWTMLLTNMNKRVRYPILMSYNGVSMDLDIRRLDFQAEGLYNALGAMHWSFDVIFVCVSNDSSLSVFRNKLELFTKRDSPTLFPTVVLTKVHGPVNLALHLQQQGLTTGIGVFYTALDRTSTSTEMNPQFALLKQSNILQLFAV